MEILPIEFNYSTNPIRYSFNYRGIAAPKDLVLCRDSLEDVFYDLSDPANPLRTGIPAFYRAPDDRLRVLEPTAEKSLPDVNGMINRMFVVYLIPELSLTVTGTYYEKYESIPVPGGDPIYKLVGYLVTDIVPGLRNQ